MVRLRRAHEGGSLGQLDLVEGPIGQRHHSEDNQLAVPCLQTFGCWVSHVEALDNNVCEHNKAVEHDIQACVTKDKTLQDAGCQHPVLVVLVEAPRHDRQPPCPESEYQGVRAVQATRGDHRGEHVHGHCDTPQEDDWHALVLVQIADGLRPGALIDRPPLIRTHKEDNLVVGRRERGKHQDGTNLAQVVPGPLQADPLKLFRHSLCFWVRSAPRGHLCKYPSKALAMREATRWPHGNPSAMPPSLSQEPRTAEEDTKAHHNNHCNDVSSLTAEIHQTIATLDLALLPQVVEAALLCVLQPHRPETGDSHER
mmetsp:Transcript_89614/g.238026  ORF Transcript_89614/g.238026 Transcript_89614/m.238026 type:complete len:312 (+) Transcript_89614:1495-2430(+)